MNHEADRSLWAWAAVLGTPSLALLNLSAGYALVGPSCAHQHSAALHGVALACLLLSGFITLRAWAEARAGFVPLIGTLIGLLMTLVIAAQWIPTWMLSPCY
jgi:hypothetical protein